MYLVFNYLRLNIAELLKVLSKKRKKIRKMNFINKNISSEGNCYISKNGIKVDDEEITAILDLLYPSQKLQKKDIREISNLRERPVGNILSVSI
ncbi:hypothetical protein [Chryseobacterium tongliaoense]|uniref:hypothetical protein n=1 Tax=Chryseobacterium tongliaoense TaxID=3240933 RepID=UPI00351698C1